MVAVTPAIGGHPEPERSSLGSPRPICERSGLVVACGSAPRSALRCCPFIVAVAFVNTDSEWGVAKTGPNLSVSERRLCGSWRGSWRGSWCGLLSTCCIAWAFGTITSTNIIRPLVSHEKALLVTCKLESPKLARGVGPTPSGTLLPGPLFAIGGLGMSHGLMVGATVPPSCCPLSAGLCVANKTGSSIPTVYSRVQFDPGHWKSTTWHSICKTSCVCNAESLNLGTRVLTTVI
jgi:hypothetical protein